MFDWMMYRMRVANAACKLVPLVPTGIRWHEVARFDPQHGLVDAIDWLWRLASPFQTEASTDYAHQTMLCLKVWAADLGVQFQWTR
jgi:hypothetical protein